MTRRLAVLLAGVFWLPSIQAQVVSPRADATVVTIYHQGDVDTSDLIASGGDRANRTQGLAFITETRTIDVPAGEAQIEFRDVASTIVPQTAEIAGLPASMLERNFDYDLLNPESLLARSVGNTVRLVRTDKTTGETTERNAVVRAAPYGTVLEIDGKFEALGCSGLPEKLVFDRIPQGLRDAPTLSIRTRAQSAGRYVVKLSYIATAMNWSADYVARVRPGGRSLDLSGWITLANFGETGFGQVPVEVVAGRLETTGEDVPVDPEHGYASSNCWPTNINWATAHRLPPPPPAPPAMRAEYDAMETVAVSGARAEIEAVALGDYKLYALPNVTDLWARQTKQVQFLDKHDVPFERIYTYASEGSTEEVPANIVLRLKNTTAAKLGKPLPAGAVTVVEPDAAGTPLLTGQDRVADTAVGLPLEIAAGRAMAVRVDSRTTETKTVRSRDGARQVGTIEIAVINGKPMTIAFEIKQSIWEQMRLTSETMRHVVKPAGIVWSFTLQPGERKVLRYTVERPG